MAKRIIILLMAGFLASLGQASSFAATKPNALAKALGEIDRNVCRSFKMTCKKKPRSHVAKPQKAVAPKPKKTEPSVEPVQNKTPPAKIAIAPPIPVPKPPVSQTIITPPPLPQVKPPKPAIIALPQPAIVPPPPIVVAQPPATGDADTACLQQLRAQGAEFEVATGIVDSGQCHVQNPVRLQAVKTQQNLVTLPEAPLLNCKFALRLSTWIRESAAPILAAQLNASVEKISTGPGYDCRGRNGDSSAKISEHGYGNAVDISTFSMHGGKVIAVQDALDTTSPSYGILHGLRASACGYFTTVLGPGSNAAHATHFHFDIGIHGKSGNYRVCE